MLAGAIKQQQLSDQQQQEELGGVSVRSFESFNLFNVIPMEDTPTERWLQYSFFASTAPPVPSTALPMPSAATATALVRMEKTLPSVHDLIGFNNTGNVCIWPSEEVMAYYVAKNPDVVSGRRVCELGAGATGLAGLVCAATSNGARASGPPALVLLSDGNARSVDGLRACVQRNTFACPTHVAQIAWGSSRSGSALEESSSQRVTVDESNCASGADAGAGAGGGCCGENEPAWSKIVSEYGRFDVILCADCLFFTDTHTGLLSLIDALLGPQVHKQGKGIYLLF